MRNSPASILILHPSVDVCRHFERSIARCGGSTRIDCHPSASMETLNSGNHQLIIAWEYMPLENNATFLDHFTHHGLSAAVIFISNNGSPQNAVAAVRAGASDYLVQTADEELIAESARHALQSSNHGRKSAHSAGPVEKEHQIVTQSGAMRDLLGIAERVARSDATILIYGESGTGKELLARHIHLNSDRGKHPMVAMNCAALPEQLAESELFGYEKGAFTGAVGKRRGRFERAHRGTLLLDEISEMPMMMQAKLLRVLQEKEIDPIGGNKPVAVDVRVIATTNKDLMKMVAAGTFREDLYYRLRVVPLKIPPLRERPEDIPLLTAFFTRKNKTADVSRHMTFNAQAMDILCSWNWPGNVRELENTVMRALLISPDEVVTPEYLLLDQPLDGSGAVDTVSLVGRTVQEIEKELISQTLAHVNQNRTHAARMLGISIRTLRNKLNAYQSAAQFPADIAFGE